MVRKNVSWPLLKLLLFLVFLALLFRPNVLDDFPALEAEQYCFEPSLDPPADPAPLALWLRDEGVLSNFFIVAAPPLALYENI